MIKYETNDKGISLQVDGDIATITAETMYMLNRIYGQLKMHAPIFGDMFRYLLVRALTDKDSPLFSEEHLMEDGEITVFTLRDRREHE